MQTLREQIDNQIQFVNAAELFLTIYGSKIPEGLGMIIFAPETPMFYVSLDGKEPSDRDRALSAMGDVFGRADWKAVLEYRGRHFDWSKTVNNVLLTISCAQLIGKPEAFPVDPKQFPLQIEG